MNSLAKLFSRDFFWDLEQEKKKNSYNLQTIFILDWLLYCNISTTREGYLPHTDMVFARNLGKLVYGGHILLQLLNVLWEIMLNLIWYRFKCDIHTAHVQ